jgi:hypothetical protein
MGAVIATERPRDWGATDYRYAVTGHLHHVHEREVGGVHLLQAPTFAPPDRWHGKHGYVTSDRGLKTYLFCERKGLVASLTARP